MEKAMWELFLGTGSILAYLGYRNAAEQGSRKDEDKWQIPSKPPVLL